MDFDNSKAIMSVATHPICKYFILNTIYNAIKSKAVKRYWRYVWLLRCCLSLELVSSIPAWSTMIYRFLCGFICVSLCQSITIKPTDMYIAKTRKQFKINTHGWCNWHLCIPDGLSVVQCSLGHVIGIEIFDTITVAWSERAGKLAAGGVASVWKWWVRSPLGPR